MRKMTIPTLTLGLLLAGGCISLPGVEVEPAKEAVLAGRWSVLIDGAAADTTLIFEFNDRGRLIEAEYNIGDSATITDTNPRASVSVDGEQVTISALIAGNGTEFTGTLDAEGGIIIGTLSTRLQVGSIVARIEQGAATLVRL